MKTIKKQFEVGKVYNGLKIERRTDKSVWIAGERFKVRNEIISDMEIEYVNYGFDSFNNVLHRIYSY